jgi:hypothetical protein
MHSHCANALPIQFPGPISAGDAIVVYAWNWSPVIETTPVELIDNQQNIYELVTQQQATCTSGAPTFAALYAGFNLPASADAPQIAFGTFGGACVEATAVAVEYTGVTAVHDQATGAAPCTSTSGCTLATSSVATTAPSLLASVATTCVYNQSGVFVTDQRQFMRLAFETDTVSFDAGVAGQLIVQTPGTYDDMWQIMFDASGSTSEMVSA